MLAPFFRFISGIDRPANSSTFCLDMVAPARFYLYIGLSLFLIWLLVICSYAGTFFHFVYWQRRASPPVDSLSWHGLACQVVFLYRFISVHNLVANLM